MDEKQRNRRNLIMFPLGTLGRDMAFSEDGAFAVGVTAAEKYVVGDLWADEDALLTQARKLTGAEP